MKKPLSTLLLLMLFVVPTWAITWNPIAAKVLKSIAYLDGPEGKCTAFSIDRERDYVLTAAHCDQKTASGESASTVDGLATVVKYKDEKKDLLVLEVKGLDKPALKLAKQNPQILDEMASCGFGMALETAGCRHTYVSDDKVYIPFEGIGGPFIMTDTTFIGGQSGGPVVNENGDVVMIVQRGSTTGFGLGVGAEIIKSKCGKYFTKEP